MKSRKRRKRMMDPSCRRGGTSATKVHVQVLSLRPTRPAAGKLIAQ